MATKHIIFDWDGTLIRTLDVWLAAYRAAFADHGHNFSDRYIVAEFFTNHHTIPERHPDIRFEPIAGQAFNSVGKNGPKASLYEGAARIAETLHLQGIDVSLVSSSGRAVLEAGLAHHAMSKQFTTTVAGDDGFGHKPSVGPFQQVLERTGYTASETLVIGDSFVDIQAGKALGSSTCHFAPETNKKFYDFAEILAMDPDHQISDLHHLLELI